MVAHAPPRIIGHRGAKGSAPENTLASICAAKAQGCAWVEVDVMLSKDKFLVIHHDNKLDRCTDAHGYVWDLTLEELQKLDAGSHFHASYAGERIPRLAEVIACCHENALLLNLEVKHVTEEASSTPTAEEAAMEEELAMLVCDEIERLKVQPQDLVFSSFSRVCISVLRRRLPHITCAFLVNIIPDDWAEFYDEHQCVSLNFDHTSNTREQVEECRRSRPDVPLFSYTVNDPARALELLTWGVSGVFSDHPALVEAGILQQERADGVIHPAPLVNAGAAAVASEAPTEVGCEAACGISVIREQGGLRRNKSWADMALDSLGESAFSAPA